MSISHDSSLPYSRRSFLEQAALLLAIPSVAGCGSKSTRTQALSNGSSSEGKTIINPGSTTLVLYFSHSGNTRVIATKIHSVIGGDLIELKTVDAYPQDYNQCVDQARKELDANFRPNLKTAIANFSDYSTIVLGYPNWWGTTPMAVATMLENYDCSGKTIIPFCTHEGSALGQSTGDIAKWSPQAMLKDGLAIRGRSVNSAGADVEKWLQRLGMVKQTPSGRLEDRA